MVRGLLTKVEKFYKKINFLDKILTIKLGEFILGFSSAIGIFFIALIFYLLINYTFLIEGKFNWILLIIYVIFNLVLNNSTKLNGRYFRIGYLMGVITFILFSIGIIKWGLNF